MTKGKKKKTKCSLQVKGISGYCCSSSLSTQLSKTADQVIDTFGIRRCGLCFLDPWGWLTQGLSGISSQTPCLTKTWLL